MSIEQFKSIPVVYIAGAYKAANSWEIEQNIRRAEATALEVLKLGAAAICPHTSNRFFYGAIPETTAMLTDTAILLRCDAVMIAPIWHNSRGTLEEINIAVMNSIPVCYTLTDLQTWMRNGWRK